MKLDTQDVLRYYSKFRSVYKAVRRSINSPRLQLFLSEFIQPGDLVFDVGANVGDYVMVCLKLGARVVAIEPQTDCLKVLVSRFGKDPRVSIESVALGETRGEGLLFLSDVRTPISSMSRDWIEAVKTSGRFRHFEWRKSQAVSVGCLDNLIEEYGIPSFCKIDVEGYERQVLKGLNFPIEKLSFEYHIECLSELESCLNRLAELGTYAFNYTIGEGARFRSSGWLNSKNLLQIFRGFSIGTLQGDIYAIRDKRALNV
ncbi:MAG: FkbM family methyltransferase [Deltaproteobacteria bacterium]|nr:FkbM family methyltransferase [Deltaproteobacteria bacterium]